MDCTRAAPSLLLHVNILLVLFSGAGLATSARLKWDPSTYLAVREVFPREYRAAAGALPLAAAVLLLMAHGAVIALRTRRSALRRALLLSYALAMALMMCGEVALLWWLSSRAAAWAHSPAADELRHALHLREHLLPLLQQLSHWHPLPAKIKSLVQEAEEDAPRNLHAAAAAAAALLLLQAAAVLLALLTARASPGPPRARHPPTLSRDDSAAGAPLRSLRSPSGSQKTPPRVVYRDGRLVMCDATTTPHSA